MSPVPGHVPKNKRTKKHLMAAQRTRLQSLHCVHEGDVPSTGNGLEFCTLRLYVSHPYPSKYLPKHVFFLSSPPSK